MSGIGYTPDNYGVVYDESEDQLYYNKNGRTPINTGGGGVTIYTGDGSLAGDRVAQMAGHDLTFIDAETHTQLAFDLGEHEATLQMSDGTTSAQINLYANAIGNLGFIIESSNGVDKDVSIIGITTDQTITYQAGTGTHIFAGKINNSGLQDFANNASAITGGLVPGDFYYTNVAGDGVLKVVL